MLRDNLFFFIVHNRHENEINENAENEGKLIDEERGSVKKLCAAP